MNLSATLAPNGRTMAHLDVPDASGMRECRVIVACPMGMMIDQTCVNVTIVDAGLLVRTPLNGSRCYAEIAYQTRVSCTTIRRSRPGLFATITNPRCFMFRTFHSPSRCLALGPPQRGCDRPRSYGHSGQAFRSIRNTKRILTIPGRTGAGPHERTIQ
jgi:hypothetical protein